LKLERFFSVGYPKIKIKRKGSGVSAVRHENGTFLCCRYTKVYMYVTTYEEKGIYDIRKKEQEKAFALLLGEG
jgi:hypothetical protein